MLMYTPSHIARIMPAGSFNQALSSFRFMERLCSGTFAFLLPAVQRNSIAQKDWQNFFSFALGCDSPFRKGREFGRRYTAGLAGRPRSNDGFADPELTGVY